MFLNMEENLHRSSKLFMVVVTAGVFYLGGQYVATAPQRAEQEVVANREIAVQGRGEAFGIPDVARLTLGVSTGPQSTADAAMKILTRNFTAVERQLQAIGIEDKDMKTTNLSVRPIYDYNDGRRTIRGYEASESIRVTIRDTAKVGEVLAKSTGEGVNQASGISFEIDDPTEVKKQAQEEAIEKAKENAKELADSLGVKLGKIKRFTVLSGGNVPERMFAAFEGSALAEDGASGPPVPAGEQDVVVTVEVTFELK